MTLMPLITGRKKEDMIARLAVLGNDNTSWLKEENSLKVSFESFLPLLSCGPKEGMLLLT
jgi:hypothetical protein